MALTFDVRNLMAANTTTANFRAWGSGIAAAFAAVGLVQTADTGQINWTTVNAPGAVNTQMGYEIWRFNDTLQGSVPIFFRIAYGSGSTAFNNPQIWITLGTATDGAGTITANASFPNTAFTARTIFNTNASFHWYQANGTSPVYVSSDSAGSVCFAGWMNTPYSQGTPAYGGGFFVIERTRDWDGTPNNQGVLFSYQPGNVSVVTQTMILANAGSFSQGAAWTGIPAIVGTSHPMVPDTGFVSGNVISTYPVFTGNTPQLNGVSKHVVATWSTDFAAYARFPLTIYAESATYLSLGSTFVGWETSGGTASGAVRVA